MRDPNRVPLSLAIDPVDKDRIRRMARREGLTMTRYILRLVCNDEEERRPQKAEGSLLQERPFKGFQNANGPYTEATD